MGDLKDPRLMYLKAALFVVIGIVSLAYIALRTQDWLLVAVAILGVWAFCRAYYFAFYVIEHYIDPGYRYDGLLSFFRRVFPKRKDGEG
ncbi:MAG: hypothetical protein AAFS11_07765 [Planctomycetota bacterium]